jgi:hypothetical protein
MTSFPCAPRGQKKWPGYIPLDSDGDGGRWDGIETEALRRLGRVQPIGGHPVAWFIPGIGWR